MMRHRRGMAGMALAGILVTACLGCEATSVGSPPHATLPRLEEAGFPQVLQQRKGKILLVEFWATWCEPCRTLFPHTVQLQRRWAEQGLELVAISLDAPEAEAEVAHFLDSQGAACDAYLSRYGASARSAAAFAIPQGRLPHLRLYDRQGKLVRAFEAGAFQPQDLQQAVAELLEPRNASIGPAGAVPRREEAGCLD